MWGELRVQPSWDDGRASVGYGARMSGGGWADPGVRAWPRSPAESTAGLEKKPSFPAWARGHVASASFLPYKTAIVHGSKDAPPPCRVSGCHSLGANSTRAVCTELGRQALGHQGHQNTACALREQSIRPEAALPHKRVGPLRRPGHLCGVRSPRTAVWSPGATYQGRASPRGAQEGPTVRGSWTRKKQDVLPPACAAPRFARFYVVFRVQPHFRPKTW